MGRLKARRKENPGAYETSSVPDPPHRDSPHQYSSYQDSRLPDPPLRDPIPTILIAADSNNTLARLRETFPAQEHNPITGNRRYRILRGGSNKPAYRLVSLGTDGTATNLVPELAWYTGILRETSAVLLVGSGPELLLADRLLGDRLRASTNEIEHSTGGPRPNAGRLQPGADLPPSSANRHDPPHHADDTDEYVPDLVAPLSPDVPVGSISDSDLLACARWLTTRFGPHRIWALHLSNHHSPDRGRRHRLLREVITALASQAPGSPEDLPADTPERTKR